MHDGISRAQEEQSNSMRSAPGLGRVKTDRRGCRPELRDEYSAMRPFRAYFSDFDHEASLVRPRGFGKSSEIAQPPESRAS